jgi:quercetin dioxygenase-like cupin family protein
VGHLPRARSTTRIIVGLHGHAVAHLGMTEHTIGPGDTIIVPAGESFSLANPHTDTFEAIAVLPVGARAALGNGQWFRPPWTE